MPDLPENDPAFLAAYLDAEKGPKHDRRKPSAGTLAAVWIAYQRSDAWKGLTSSYRQLMRRDAERVIEKGGHVPVRQIRTEHIRRDMAALAGHAANKRLKTWRALMRQAVEMTLISDNPARSVEKRKTAKATPHAPWSVDDMAAYRKHWPIGSTQRLAFELLQWTGARVSDVVRLGEGMVDRQGWMTFRQQKTGGEVSIPLRRALPAFANPADLHQLVTAIDAITDRHMTWLTTGQGAGRSQKSVSAWFAGSARAAGIQKSAHGLRATRAVLLAEAGATIHQIGAWTGHTSLSEIEHYSQSANRKRLLDGGAADMKNGTGD
jgi:site-specific recombinase XerD